MVIDTGSVHSESRSFLGICHAFPFELGMKDREEQARRIHVELLQRALDELASSLKYQ